MKIKSARFIISAPTIAACPASNQVEFALAGRSNVGKSSLLNMITGQKDLAKVSATPGHTRLINFFAINEQWTLVDLPGYGYAKTAKNDPQQFQAMVADYLLNRENLRRVFVLIDSRLEPQSIDLEFIQWLFDHEVRFALVFTKCDKLKSAALAKSIAAFRACLKGPEELQPEVFTTSSKDRTGAKELLSFIGQRLSMTNAE